MSDDVFLPPGAEAFGNQHLVPRSGKLSGWWWWCLGWEMLVELFGAAPMTSRLDLLTAANDDPPPPLLEGSGPGGGGAVGGDFQLFFLCIPSILLFCLLLFSDSQISFYTTSQSISLPT